MKKYKTKVELIKNNQTKYSEKQLNKKFMEKDRTKIEKIKNSQTEYWEK